MKMNNLYISSTNLKKIRIGIIALDVFAVLLLIFQIIFNEISYFIHILLIILNIIVFIIKPEKKSNY